MEWREQPFYGENMCQFKSAIVTKDGTVFHHELTDSHELLIDHFGLKEGDAAGFAHANFVRVEFYPDGKADIAKPEKYRLRVDERETPVWFTEEIRQTATATLTAIIEKMIVRDERRVLLGGAWIFDGGTVYRACGIRLIAAINKANLRRADLRGADLTGADLTGADLRGADLRGADLTGADLTGADLTGADLRRADLRRADLTGAYLRGAYRNQSDALIAGWKLVNGILVKK